MFYSWQILAKGGPLQVVWLAAHTDPRNLERQKVVAASIPASIESILHPKDPAGCLAKGPGNKGSSASQAAAAHGLLQGSSEGAGAEAAPLALRLSGQLLLGVVRVYNKKASLLEGDLSETLERLQREVSTPLEPLAKASAWPAALGKSKGGAGRTIGKGADDSREGERCAAEGGAGEVVGISGEGVRGGAGGRKSKDGLVENAGVGRGRSRRAVYREEGADGAELQEWMAELAAAEEEEVFLRRGSGQFVDGGGSGLSQSVLTPGRHSLHRTLHHQRQQQQHTWGGGSASWGGVTRGFVQGQFGFQSPSAASQEVAAAGGTQRGVTGQGGGLGLEAGEDEVFEGGDLECEYDLNRLDLSGQEAALLTQPSAAPSPLKDERLKPQANGHIEAGVCLDAAAGKLTGTLDADQEGSHQKSEEQCDRSAGLLDVGSMEADGMMMEGATYGDMPDTRPLPKTLHHGEATPSNAIFGRVHETLPSADADIATVPTDDQHLEHFSDAGRDLASTQAYKAGRAPLFEDAAAGKSSGGVDRDQPGSDLECLPSGQEGQHTATEDGSSRRRSSSARCLLPLFTSSQSTQITEQGKQQQQQQQQQKARVPLPEHCPHSRLGLRRMRMEQSSAGVGGYKVEGLGKVVNAIELSSSTIKQLLRDSRPLLDHTRLERCSLRTALLQPKVPTNLPYLLLGAASDIPLLLLPPPSYYYPTPTMDASTEGALRPSIPPEVSAVPELAFVLHESGLCSPSHLTPELQWLVYEALGWGAQPVGLQQRDQHADQKQRQQQQRTERARCRSQAERSKRPEVSVKQKAGPSREAAQRREAANDGHRVESGGGTQAGPEVGQEEGLQGGDLQELGGPNGQVLGDQEGFEGQEEQEQSQQEQHHCQQQDAGEQDVEESEGGGGNLHGSKLWRDVQFELGVGSQGAQDGFTARTHKLLLHLQQLFLGREGDRKGKGRDLLESPTKKRRTQQAEKGKGRLHEVSMIRELLAEQLQAAAKAQAPCERGKSGTERHTSLGASACPAPSHRICAARTFHDMLVLQSKGYVRVKQDESYGDLHVREGQKLVKCVGDLPLAHE